VAGEAGQALLTQAIFPAITVSDTYSTQNEIALSNTVSEINIYPSANLPVEVSVRFTATDGSGNARTEALLLRLDDTTPPSITPRQGAVIPFEPGVPFTDPGVDVSDLLDSVLQRPLPVTIRINLEVEGPRYSPNLCPVSSALEFSVIPPEIPHPGAATVTGTAVDAYAPDGSVYSILYRTADRRGNSVQAEVRINVDDTLEPAIQLKEASEIFFEYNPSGDAFLDPGAEALDQLDGDLSRNICVQVETYAAPTPGVAARNPFSLSDRSARASPPSHRLDAVRSDAPVGTVFRILYDSVDGAGNRATIARVVAVIDSTPPEVQLIGPAVQQVFYNTEYREMGATASDLNDSPTQMERIVAFVGNTGELDAQQPGKYQVVYAFKDRNGNVGERNRTVVVQARPEEDAVPGSALVNLTLYQPLADTAAQVVAIEDELTGLVSDIFPVIVQIYDPDLLSTRYTDNFKTGRKQRREQYWIRKDEPGRRTTVVLAAREASDFRWITAREFEVKLFAALAQVKGVLASANNSRIDLAMRGRSEDPSFGTGAIVGVALVAVVALVAGILIAVRWHVRRTPKRRSDAHGLQLHAPAIIMMYNNPLIDASHPPDRAAARVDLSHMYAAPSQATTSGDGDVSPQGGHDAAHGAAKPMNSPKPSRRATVYLVPRSKVMRDDDAGGYSSLQPDHEIYKTSEQVGDDALDLAAPLPGEYNCVESEERDAPALPPRMYAEGALDLDFGSAPPLLPRMHVDGTESKRLLAVAGYSALEPDHAIYPEWSSSA
jgi:hypothetical protein